MRADHRALAPDDNRPAQADAVIYLLRHARGDMRFLGLPATSWPCR
jgi:hypothetical protein